MSEIEQCTLLYTTMIQYKMKVKRHRVAIVINDCIDPSTNNFVNRISSKAGNAWIIPKLQYCYLNYAFWPRQFISAGNSYYFISIVLYLYCRSASFATTY